MKRITASVAILLMGLFALFLLATSCGSPDSKYISEKEQEHIDSGTAWIHLGNGLMYRCVNTTAVYALQAQGSLSGVGNDPLCDGKEK